MNDTTVYMARQTLSWMQLLEAKQCVLRLPHTTTSVVQWKKQRCSIRNTVSPPSLPGCRARADLHCRLYWPSLWPRFITSSPDRLIVGVAQSPRASVDGRDRRYRAEAAIITQDRDTEYIERGISAISRPRLVSEWRGSERMTLISSSLVVGVNSWTTRPRPGQRCLRPRAHYEWRNSNSTDREIYSLCYNLRLLTNRRSW